MAVSGGVDSIVLLDMLVRERGHDLVVAHFDHGIRADSASDARFVEAVARQYGLSFVTKREELGGGAGEELARARRYAFLREESVKEGAAIVTAHHQDDLIESVAINLLRGTGWRGLAVFGSADIWRPLIRFTKEELRTYARIHRLEWVEDSTNLSTHYLRNRVRGQLKRGLSDGQRKGVVKLWERQTALRGQIDDELSMYLNDMGEYSRHLLIMADQAVGCELLRSMIQAKTGVAPTRPQVERALLAVKTTRAGSNFEVGSGITLRFTASTFIA